MDLYRTASDASGASGSSRASTPPPQTPTFPGLHFDQHSTPKGAKVERNGSVRSLTSRWEAIGTTSPSSASKVAAWQRSSPQKSPVVTRTAPVYEPVSPQKAAVDAILARTASQRSSPIKQQEQPIDIERLLSHRKTQSASVLTDLPNGHSARFDLDRISEHEYLAEQAERFAAMNFDHIEDPVDRALAMSRARRGLDPVKMALAASAREIAAEQKATFSGTRSLSGSKAESDLPLLPYGTSAEITRTPSPFTHRRAQTVTTIQATELYKDSVRRELQRKPAQSPTLPSLEQLVGGSENVPVKPNRMPRKRLHTDSSVTSKSGVVLPSKTTKALDAQRQHMQAYEYLCHVEEARQWLINTLRTGEPDARRFADELDRESAVDLESSLRNGIALALLARQFLGPNRLPRIFMERSPLAYRHVENINSFFCLTNHVSLPSVYMFETNDLYNARNVPKVLFCLHALSHHLADRGLAARMNNLFGQVDFSETDLVSIQRGLDIIGARMPNFKDLQEAEPEEPEPDTEPEPQPESEAQRRQRLFCECQYRLASFPARARGFLARKRHQVDAASWHKRTFLDDGLPRFQAAARRKIALERQDDLRDELRRLNRSNVYSRLQAACRAKMVRQKEAQRARSITRQAGAIEAFQSVARGKLLRDRYNAPLRQAAWHEPQVALLQARIRGAMARARHIARVDALAAAVPLIQKLQGHARGCLTRRKQHALHRSLNRTSDVISRFQAIARGLLIRRRNDSIRALLQQGNVVQWASKLQRITRAAVVRRQHDTDRKQLEFAQPDVIGVQNAARGYLVRKYWVPWRDYLRTPEVDAAATALQALARGLIVRRQYFERLAHYYQNERQVALVQAVVRQRQQRRLYLQLMQGKHVTIDAIKNFLDLLRDSACDFKEEMELEDMQHKLVEKIRRNQERESRSADLEHKVELLVKGKITLDEVERARRAGLRDEEAKQQVNTVLMAARDPFALGSLDNATRRKLELYQELFHLLQVQPEYIARLLRRLSGANPADKERRNLERVILAVFGLAQQSREEYLLLKVMQSGFAEEMDSARTMKEFLGANTTVFRLMTQYIRGDKQRQYLVDTFGPLISELVASNGEVELVVNPLEIYQACMNSEEQQTGQISHRRPDPTYQQAVQDSETRTIFIHRAQFSELMLVVVQITRTELQTLRKLTHDFTTAIFGSASKLPFGLRWLSRELHRGLKANFPEEDEHSILLAVGHLIFTKYLNPALMAPDSCGVIPSSPPISSIDRRNLSEISRVLAAIAKGELFGDDVHHLTPLNDYVADASRTYQAWTSEVIAVDDAETFFDANLYMDYSAARRPTVSISPNEIYAMHDVLLEDLSAVAPLQSDPLRIVLEELGPRPRTASYDLARARDGQIRLALASRLPVAQDHHALDKALWVRTKRFVLAHIKVQPGTDLLESLLLDATAEDEETWTSIALIEIQESKRADQRRRSVRAPKSSSNSQTGDDELYAMSFVKVKEAALSGLLEMEAKGLVKREDGFQGMIDAIAIDIRTKSSQRVKRRAEMERVSNTIAGLNKKAKYLDEQLKLFNDYAESAKTNMHKKRKSRLVMPWTRQGKHERWLAKQGLRYKYGSYAYSAVDLQRQGVLLSVNNSVGVDFSSIELILSCKEEGVFEMQAKVLGMTVASSVLQWEDLLDAQFNGARSLNIDDLAKVNLNLLLHLINKRFLLKA